MATYSIITEADWDTDEERIRSIDGRDRGYLFVDGSGLQLNTRQKSAKISVEEKKTLQHIDILIENMGRVNHGHKFLNTQRKNSLECL